MAKKGKGAGKDAEGRDTKGGKGSSAAGSDGKDSEGTEVKGTEGEGAEVKGTEGKSTEGEKENPKIRTQATASKSAAKKPRVESGGNGAKKRRTRGVKEDDDAAAEETEQAEETKVEPPPRKRRAKKTDPPQAAEGVEENVEEKAEPKAKAKGKAKAKANAKGKAKAKASSAGRRQFVSTEEVEATGHSWGDDVDGDGLRRAVTKDVLECLHLCKDHGSLNGKGRHNHAHEDWSENDQDLQLSAYWTRKCVGIKTVVDKKWSQVAYFSRPTPCTATNLILAKYWVRVSFASNIIGQPAFFI